MSIKLGLTGSIGMGKSTTAAMFVARGCVVWDADAAVARLYGPNGAAVSGIAAIWPNAVQDGAVDRAALRAVIRQDRRALNQIEAIVHPLVRADRATFQAQTQAAITVFDIPLLFETGAEREMDAVACVTVSPEVQRARVLARGTMSAQDLDAILEKQMPNAEKCARSDFVIDTTTLSGAENQVDDIIKILEARYSNA